MFSIAGGCTSGNFDTRPVLGVSGYTDVDSAKLYMDKAKKDFVSKRFGLAISKYRKALKIDPTSIDAMNGLAASYDKIDRFDMSSHFYKMALAQNPDSKVTLNNLGYSYYLQRKPGVAVIYLREAVKDNKETDPLIHENIRLAQSAIEPNVRNLSNKPSHYVKRKRQQVKFLSTKSHKKNKFPKLVRIAVSTYALISRPTKKIRRFDRGVDSLADETFNSPAPKMLPARFGVQISKKRNEIPRPASARSIMSVSNGTGRRNMSARTARYLTESGHDVATIDNAKTFNKRVSTIFFKPGHKQAAV
jgi:tetratricopeptide (TPR) repeat protein